MKLLNKSIFTLHLGKFNFAPSWLSLILMLIFFPPLISLGCWQLHRAEFKRELLTEYEARQNLPPLTTPQLSGDINLYKYYPVQLTGFYDNAHTIFLDNKFYEHHVGYHVLMPFKAHNGTTVLIDRGWIPRNNNPRQLPVVAPIVGEQIVQGLIDIPTQKPFLLQAQPDSAQQWPLLVQAIELDKLAHVLDQPLLQFVVLLSPKLPGPEVRDWHPVTMMPQKHLGYAVQWFALATTLVILFIVTATRRRV